MISGGRLIGRAEDEVESVEREVVSWCLDIFGVEVQRKGLGQRKGTGGLTSSVRAAAGFRDLGSHARQIVSRRGSVSRL